MRRIGRPLSLAKIRRASLVCVWLLSGGRCLQAQSANQENGLQPAAKSAREVLHGVRDSFARIRSIHYTFESTRFSTIPASKPAHTTRTDAEFAFDNGKFYSSSNVVTPEQQKVFQARAFDGSKYQRYDDSNELMIFSEIPEQPYGVVQPVMYLFSFARSSTERLTFQGNQETWDQLGNRAKLEASEIVNGHPCEVVSFTTPSGTSPKREVFQKVFAARDLGYYPVRRTTAYGTTRSVLDVTEWKVVPGATGDVVIPIKILSESRDEAGLLISSTSYAVNLISVNAEMADSLFSLMRFKPERVRHVD